MIKASELQSILVERNGFQDECASLQAEKVELVKTQQKVTANLQSKCAALRSEIEALQLQHQKELERRLEALQLQHQRESVNREAQPDVAKRQCRGSPLGRHCQRRGGTGRRQHRRLPLSCLAAACFEGRLSVATARGTWPSPASRITSQPPRPVPRGTYQPPASRVTS